ncbi:SHOCT domain-containing protein [Okibacterium endophyticum]
MVGDLFTSFWDFISSLFWIFVLVAYLFTLFTIVWDLVSDRTLNGWAKAAWIVFLLFVPVLTALVYLIARGRGMAERQNERAQANKQVADDYIRSVAGHGPASEIARAKDLLDAGAISEDEFSTLKRNALEHVPARSGGQPSLAPGN